MGYYRARRGGCDQHRYWHRIGTRHIKAANAANAATALQQRQSDLLNRELKLTEQQATDTRELARPKLQASIRSSGNLNIEVELHYVQGTLPATDIQLWIRRRARDEGGWGLFVTWVGYMTGGEKFILTLTSASATDQERSPFPEFLNEEPAEGESFVGLVWKSALGDQRTAQRQYAGGNRPVAPFKIG